MSAGKSNALARGEWKFTMRVVLLTGYLIGALAEAWTRVSVWLILAGVAIGLLLAVVLAAVDVWKAYR